MFAADAGATHDVCFTAINKIVFKISNMERRVRLSSTTVVSVTLREGQVD